VVACLQENTLKTENVVYLGPAFLFAAFACLFYVPGFLDMPLGEITSRQIVSELLFSVFGLIALAALARSIEFDPVWPWRPEFRRLLKRLGWVGRAD
jgi:hypothetical protein